jgi:hypothetical protein
LEILTNLKTDNIMKTAVEWLYETLWKQTDFSLPNNILEQAKEMEKQQIVEARVKKPLQSEWDEAEQYYNETFNK